MGNPVDELYRSMLTLRGTRISQPAELMQLSPQLAVIHVPSATLPPAAHTACYVTERSIFDPAPDSEVTCNQLLANLRGRTIERVVLTHHHGDHVAFAPTIAAAIGARIFAHPYTIARLGWANCSPLVDGDTVDEFRAIHTPGHAYGHLAFFDGTDLLAGDMVASASSILIDPEEGDMLQYLESLSRLLQLRPTRVLPAHGDVRGPDLIAATRQHRLAREERIIHVLPGTLEDLLPLVYADTPTALWPLAARSLRAHLDALVKRGVVRLHDATYQHAKC